MSFGTGNPVPSTDARDLSDNAENFDSATNSQLDVWSDRLGISRDTVAGRIKKMGFAVPIAYAGGIVFATNDNVKTVDESGVVYAPLPSALPFTTSGTFVGDDDVRFFVVQSFIPFKSVKSFLTIASAIADTGLVDGDTFKLTADRGNSTWNVVLKSGVTVSTEAPLKGNVVASTGDITLAFVLENKTPADLFEWGCGLGITSDEVTIQSAVDQGFLTFQNSDGTYLIGDSGTTIDYRGIVNAKVGVALPSNVVMRFSGYNSIVKAKDASNCIPFTASGKSNVSMGNFRLEGNAPNQTESIVFGIYCLNCAGVNYTDEIWINESRNNTIDNIGCTDVTMNIIHNETSTANNSIGGGPQFEDCVGVHCNLVDGTTFDDLVAVIAMSGNVADHKFVSIKGKSENSRALFIGQSISAIAQRTISNIKADIQSHECGKLAVTAAFTIFEGALYDNIKVDIVDRDSYQSLRITPYDAARDGALKNCVFNVQSFNADTFAAEVRHNGNAGIEIEGNEINLMSTNSNVIDNNVEALKIFGGDRWAIDTNITYPTGKVNKQAGVTLGTVGSANAKVTNSTLSGMVKGGDLNVKLNSTDNVVLDKLIMKDSEDANNTNLEIKVDATNTKIGTIIRDGEITNLGANTDRNVMQLFRETGTFSTSGTGTTDFMSYTLQEDFMGTDGFIHIHATGTIAGLTDTKELTFHFGPTAVPIHPLANDVGDWDIDIYLHQIGTRVSQRMYITALYGASLTSTILLNDGLTIGTDTRVPVIIKFSGRTTNAGDDVSQRTMEIYGT